METETKQIKARFVRQGDVVITAANASGNVPDIEREVAVVFTDSTFSQIHCIDGTVWDFPREAMVPIVEVSE